MSNELPFLSFMSGLIKEKGLTTEGFIDKAGLNKSQFYRGAKEPDKYFTDTDLLNMAKILELDDNQKSILFSYKIKKDPEHNEINNWIHKIMYTDPYEHKAEDRYDFDCYEKSTDNSNPNIMKRSDKTLAKYIVDLCSDPDAEVKLHHSIHITIFNCYNREKLSALSNLFLEIEKDILGKDISLRINHFLNVSTEQIESKTIIDKLEQLYIIMPLISTFTDYNILERNLSFPIWNKDDDLCLIKYELQNPKAEKDKKVKCNYFILNMNRKGKCYVLLLLGENQKYIYDYFRIDAWGLSFDKKSNNNLLNVNVSIYEYAINHKKIVYYDTLCFDNIRQDYWEVLKNTIDLKFKEALTNILDPNGILGSFSIEQKLQYGIEYIGKRYKENEKMGAINIISAIGLAEFAKNGYIADLNIDVSINADSEKVILGDNIKFDSIVVGEILTEIKDRLGKNVKNEGYQEYYILKPRSLNKQYSFSIYQNKNIWPLSPESLHRFDKLALYEDPDVANAMYSYIIDEIINKQNNPESIIMSKDEASTYIDRLIENLNLSNSKNGV